MRNAERATLVLACLAVVLIQALVAGINLAIPQLAGSTLHPSGSQLVWIVDTYVIVFAALLIPAGALGDRWGRKGALLSGLVLFAVANVVSAYAGSVLVLQAGRGLAGAAAALAQPATLSLLLHVTSPQRRAHAIALWTTAMGMGGLVGNLVAGSVLRWFDWPALFLVFVPVTIAVAAGVAVLVPKAPRHPANADPVGTLLLTAGLFALLFGIIEGPGHGWGSSEVLIGFAAGAVLLGAFAGFETTTAKPLLDPRVFRIGSVRAGTLGVAAGFFALFGLFYINAQFLQEVKGYSTLVTGVAITPLAVGMGVIAPRTVALAERLGARTMVAAGLGTIVAGLLLLSTATAHTPYAIYAVYLFVMAVGMGACAPALTGGILAGLPAGAAGLGSGLNSAAREVGAALGIATIGTILNAHTDFAAGLAVGYRSLAVILAVLAVAVVAMWQPAAKLPQPAGV